MSYNPNNPNGQATSANSAPVVVASDQSTLPISQKAGAIPTATTMQTSATANGNGTSLPVTGYSTAVINVVSSPSMSGGTTVNFEASVDDTTWVAINFHTVGTSTIATTTTSDGDFRINAAGYKSIRARISGYSAGTVTVKGYVLAGAGPVTTVNANIVANTATNQSFNVAQVAGTTTDVNSGSKSAGTLRVVLATDQPQLTNKLLVTPDANSAINVAQINGHTTVEGGVNGSQSVGGPTAAASSIAANPLTIGGRGSTSSVTSVTDGQVVNAMFNKQGAQVVVGHLRELMGNQQTSISNTTSETTIITADATYLLDLYGLILTNTSSTFTKVTIKDATAGTTRAVISVPAQDTRGFMLNVDSGHKQATVNNNWTATCGTAVTTIEVTALYAKRL